jgi:hypothetical protein
MKRSGSEEYKYKYKEKLWTSCLGLRLTYSSIKKTLDLLFRIASDVLFYKKTLDLLFRIASDVLFYKKKLWTSCLGLRLTYSSYNPWP